MKKSQRVAMFVVLGLIGAGIAALIVWAAISFSAKAKARRRRAAANAAANAAAARPEKPRDLPPQQKTQVVVASVGPPRVPDPPKAPAPEKKKPDPKQDPEAAAPEPICRGAERLGYKYWGWGKTKNAKACCRRNDNTECKSWDEVSNMLNPKPIIVPPAPKPQEPVDLPKPPKSKPPKPQKPPQTIQVSPQKPPQTIQVSPPAKPTCRGAEKFGYAYWGWKGTPSDGGCCKNSNNTDCKTYGQITELLKPQSPPPNKGFATRYFLGTAFEPLARYLASNPPDWKAVRDRIGWWNHGMGQDAAKLLGFEREYVRSFGVKQILMESSMSLTDGYLFNVPFSQVERAVQLDPAYRCAGYLPFFENEALLDGADLLLSRYKQTFAAFDRSPFKTKNFVFFAPPSKPDLLPRMMQPFRGHSSMTDWLYAQSGASGIAIDFPWRYRDEPKSLACAKQMYAETRKRGGLFVWVFDGSGRASDNVRCAQKVKSMGIDPDAWVVDQFNKYTDYKQWGEASYYGPEECVKIITALMAANV